MRCFNLFVPVTALIVGVTCVSALAQMPTYNLGRTPSAEEIRTADIAVGPEGKELPLGSGTAKEGAKIYAQKCALCHGPNEEGSVGPKGPMGPALVGGKGTLNTMRPMKTIGTYWPFATTIWDTINRAMPWGAEGTLSADEVYALTAFLLFKNDIIKEDDVMDAKSLPKIKMPNRDGFVPPRPEDIVRQRHCYIGTCP